MEKPSKIRSLQTQPFFHREGISFALLPAQAASFTQGIRTEKTGEAQRLTGKIRFSKESTPVCNVAMFAEGKAIVQTIEELFLVDVQEFLNSVSEELEDRLAEEVEIFNFLGTNFGFQPWQNPVTRHLVQGPINAVDQNSATSSVSSPQWRPVSRFDFSSKVLVQPTEIQIESSDELWFKTTVYGVTEFDEPVLLLEEEPHTFWLEGPATFALETDQWFKSIGVRKDPIAVNAIGLFLVLDESTWDNIEGYNLGSISELDQFQTEANENPLNFFLGVATLQLFDVFTFDNFEGYNLGSISQLDQSTNQNISPGFQTGSFTAL